MNQKNILFASDFSDYSTKALSQITPLIKQLDGKLSLIHVIKSYLSDWVSSGEVERVAEQRLRRWMERLESEGAKTGSVFVEVGNVADSVLKTADIMNADIIIIGAEQKSKLKKLMFGTSAEAIIRHARQIVWVHQADSYNGIHKIVCGVDFSPTSQHALQKALSMAKNFNALLVVLHVIREPNIESIGMSLSIEEEKINAYKAKKDEELSDFVGKFDADGIDLKKYVLWGNPSSVILDYAQDENVDLIVLGEKGNGQLKHLVLGSTPENVMRSAACSLLICR